MAILNNLADVNQLLKQKGLQPIEVEGYDLTITEEKIKAFEETLKETVDESSTPSVGEQLILQSIQEVIGHYQLDEVDGYYGFHENEDSAESDVLEFETLKLRQGIHYQVLNQKKILWEFFKRNCYRQQALDYLTQYDQLYRLAIQHVDEMVAV